MPDNPADPILFSPIFWIALSLLLSALFSGLEIAFLSTNKLDLELEKSQNNKRAILASKFYKNPSKFISAVLIGNNLSLVFYGLMMSDFLDNLLPESLVNVFWRYIVILLISTFIVLLFAEFLPKFIFQSKANKILLALIFPFNFFYILLYPFVILVNGVSKFFFKVFTGENMDENQSALGKIDLNYFVNSIEADDDNNLIDTETFKNALDFDTIQLRSCMLHRTNIIAVDINDNIGKIQKEFNEHKLSRILVYNGNIDEIVGYVHIFDLFNNPSNIKSIMLPVSIMTESTLASVALKELIRKRRNMAVIVNEYGGTAGIVTVEDILEEILGEINDEFDEENFVEKRINDNEFVFSASLEISYINQQYDNIDIPESQDYNSLGGYILQINGHIPEKDEVIENELYKFTIMEVSPEMIEKVKMEILEVSE